MPVPGRIVALSAVVLVVAIVVASVIDRPAVFLWTLAIAAVVLTPIELKYLWSRPRPRVPSLKEG